MNHSASCSLLLLLAFQVGLAADRGWKTPKTEHGHPDLQGTWDFGTKTPFQRPQALAEKRAYTEQEAREFERKEHEANVRLDAPVDLTKDAPTVGGVIGEEA